MNIPEGKKIVLFDGVCNLCNNAVQFAIRHDRYNQLLFAALQSEAGRELVRERAIDSSKVDSIVFIEPGMAYYTESDAALKIGCEFGGIWKLLQVLELIPKTLRDPLYRWVAKNRYTWFGKRSQCMVPNPELLSKFLK